MNHANDGGSVLILAIAVMELLTGAPGDAGREIREREEFAARTRDVITRGDVEGFIGLLSANEIVCNDGFVSSREVAEELRAKRGFYPLLFDTEALKGDVQSVRPVLSYRDFFRRAADAKAHVDLTFNTIQWASAALGEVAERPYLGVHRERGKLRIGLIGERCH